MTEDESALDKLFETDEEKFDEQRDEREEPDHEAPGPKVATGGKAHPVKLTVGGETVYFSSEEEAETAALMVLRAVNGGSVLLDAYTTGQERGRQYGPPDENFDAAARLKSGYLGADMDGFDYAIEMILTKIARLQTGGRDRDTLVDIAGYARGAAVYEGVNDE